MSSPHYCLLQGCTASLFSFVNRSDIYVCPQGPHGCLEWPLGKGGRGEGGLASSCPCRSYFNVTECICPRTLLVPFSRLSPIESSPCPVVGSQGLDSCKGCWSSRAPPLRPEQERMWSPGGSSSLQPCVPFQVEVQGSRQAHRAHPNPKEGHELFIS